MPNFLKSIFKASSSRPPAAERDRSTSIRVHDTQTRASDDRLLRPKPGLREGEESGKEKGKVRARLTRGSERERTSASSHSTSASLLDHAIEVCTGAIVSCASLRLVDQDGAHLVARICSLLEAQIDELRDIAPYTGRTRYPALITLEQIYDKVQSGLEHMDGRTERQARIGLATLVQVLQEGPDYLIDIILINSIIHHAALLSLPLSREIRNILHSALDERDLPSFRPAAESIVAVASAVDRRLLEESRGQRAYKDIGVLVKQLQVRVASSALPTPVPSLPTSGFATPSTPTPLTLPSTPADSPYASRSPTPSPSSSPVYRSLTTSELQSAYGSGQATPTPLPGLSSYTPTPGTTARPTPAASAPASPTTSDSSSEEVWEYRGQLLTRSALDLVLRREALAQADSSGQWAGDVSWDDLRQAWIPNWAQKLKVSDLADGEVPDTTPAGFKVKDKDEWGNKIGWYGPFKEMYYKEEPKWELPD